MNVKHITDTSNNLAAYEMGARVTLAINNRKGLLNNTYAMYASENGKRKSSKIFKCACNIKMCLQNVLLTQRRPSKATE